jgi:DNA repair protein RadD
MIPTLRGHQQENLDQLREQLRRCHSALLVAPCGYGKGTIITVMVHNAVQRGRRVIFAVHGKSLVTDMSQRVARLGIEHGVLLGGVRREHWHPVQVASIDTLHRMEFPPVADLLICDEAHMCLSATWRKTLARFPSAKIVGMTATPIRLDRKGLGTATGGLFDTLVLGPTEVDLIKAGYLVGSRVLAPPAPDGLADVKKVAGEFPAAGLAQVCDKTKIIGDIVEHWKRHASDRKTAAFGCDQAHARHITEQFNVAGVNWAYVDADTPESERQKIWKDLDYGDLRGVSSVGCISIGWDHSVVSCLIAARKTASLGWWRQMLGRGSRVHPGKTEFLVLDHVGNTLFHAPFGFFEDEIPWSLEGEAIKMDPRPVQRVSTCKACYATFRAGPKVCPYCGAVLEKQVKEVEQVDGALAELQRAAQQQAMARNGRATLDALLATARERGYKRGWAMHVFKNKYGMWPPRGWMPRETGAGI